MTGHKQCCANCYFFQDSGLSGQGHCTHPKRNEPGGGPGRLVRKQELACRNGWGDNLFTDPATMDNGTADDRLVAQSTMSPSRPEAAREPDDRLVARDYSPNTAAQNDQDDRTASMQRGPGDALRSAQSRYRDRQSGATRRPDIETPIPEHLTETQTPEFDESASATRRPAPQRSIIPAVPRDEIRTRHRDDSTIWDEIPAIAADVELPLLREQFRLPGQPSSDAGPTTASPKEPSRFELTLRKAEEHRRAKAREAGGADDHVTSSAPVSEPAEVQPRPAPVDDAPADEVVRYQPQRGTELDRFRAAPEPLETDDAYLDEDYELDRTWRAEATSRHNEDRWWKSRGRYRLFGNHRQKPDTLSAEPDAFAFEPETDPGHPDVDLTPAPRTPAPGMTITWDDRTLAPQPSLPHVFASLDYLDEDPGPDDRSLPSWRDVESPFTTPTPAQPVPAQVGERIAGTDRRLHRWTYREATPEPASGPPTPAARIAQPVAPVPTPAPETPSPDEPDFDLDTVVATDVDIRRIIARNTEPLLDMTIGIAPDVPRECGTCRHFRASGTGERGWCTNTWAFPHRPLVNADAVHCTSTIGCWWLPTDDDWDPEEYFDWLDQETPRADRLIAALYGEEPDRRYGN